MAYKGRFKCSNPSKYKGDPSKIIYRSSWELKAFSWLDKNPDVLQWSSEETIIPYVSPKDNKVHRYFPDLVFKIKKNDKIETYMIEIKPASQTQPPNPAKRNATPTGRVSTRFLREAATFSINDAKWKAAQKYCDKKGWKFAVWTETHLGIK